MLLGMSHGMNHICHHLLPAVVWTCLVILAQGLPQHEVGLAQTSSKPPMEGHLHPFPNPGPSEDPLEFQPWHSPFLECCLQARAHHS